MATPGAWSIVRNDLEVVTRGTPSDNQVAALRAVADTAESLLRARYPRRVIRRSGNRDSAYVDVMADDGNTVLQREYFVIHEE